MAATASARSCSSFSNFRSSSDESRARATSSHGCGKLDGVAMWFINGVATAFFASLERCSCIRIATHEDPDEPNDDAPLILDDGNLRHDGGFAGRRRIAGKRNKNKAGH